VFLKSLDIFGFKSFADRTRIEFADGISALLGPNGCGKSNVVDAIKWVLGEQASKSLRAEAMEDVIFNGTESRKAVNVAEVALTLGNENGLLPLDMPEIVVKRRLFRNGDSEYFINSAPVRLKDVRELFYDTGVGKSAYSIMEQGKIDQVLSNRPEERRLLFEEAAGITKYRIRGQEAERKLEKTDENLRQVEGILGEVRRSYESLKKQAEKTKTYHHLRDEIFTHELSLQLIRLRELTEQREKQKKQNESLQAERDGLKNTIDGINETLESSLDEMNTMEAQLIESQKNLYGLDIEKNNQDSQIRLLQERIAEIEEKLRSDAARAEALAEKRSQLSKDSLQAQTGLEEICKEIDQNEEHIKRFAQNVDNAQKRIQSDRDETLRLEERIQSLESQDLALQQALRDLTDNIVSQLDRSLGESGYDQLQRKEAQDLVNRSLEGLGISLRGRKELLKDLLRHPGQDDLSRLEDLFQELNRQLDQLKEAFEKYQSTLPVFLDEFLAPEGTITQKRDLDAQSEAARSAISQHRQKIAQLTEEIQNLTAKINEYRDTLEDLRLGKERLLGQKKALEEQLERYKLQDKELEGQIREIQGLIAEDQGRIKGIQEKIQELQAVRKALEKQEADLRKQLGQLEKGISNRSKTLLSKEKQLKTQTGQLAALQEKIEKINLQLTETLTEIRAQYANFKERYSRDLAEYESQMYEIQEDVRSLKEKAQKLKEELKELGSVNLMAPEEFAEVKERFDFLNTQTEDLRKAREDLVRITSEIRSESSQLFLETFESIRGHFHVLFRRLFGGGRAEIRLSEPDRVLESGIEIFAQPPGKKLENIALLSGGERSLTAVALLFATYIVKPSPFCLLDEIDAALDESNVGRFVNILMEFGETSQFIVITHNKKTVTGARTLLGVTMEESGVSKIIAIRLAHEEAVDPDPELENKSLDELKAQKDSADTQSSVPNLQAESFSSEDPEES